MNELFCSGTVSRDFLHYVFSSIVSKNYVGKQELILKSIGYFSVIVLVLLKGMCHEIFDLHFIS